MAHGPSGVGFDGDAGHSGHGHFGLSEGLDADMGSFGCYCDGHGHYGIATHEAIVAFHSFCSDHSFEINVDNAVDIGHSHFGGHGLMSALGTAFDGIVEDSKEALGLVVVGHDYLDTRSVVVNILRSLGLMELYTPQGSRKRIDLYDKAIMPMMPAKGGEAAVMPDGYYQGATGMTTQWRSFWQLGKQDFWDKLCGRPLELNPKARWNIAISVVQWYFAESDDYETRVLANVWNGDHMGATAEHRATHMEAARAFVKQLAQALRLRPPSARSRQYRAQLLAVQQCVANEVAVPVF